MPDTKDPPHDGPPTPLSPQLRCAMEQLFDATSLVVAGLEQRRRRLPSRTCVRIT